MASEDLGEDGDFGGEAASGNRVTNRPVSKFNLQPLMATSHYRILEGFGGASLSQTTVGEGGGQNWIRTSEGVSQRIYSPPRLATSVSTLDCFATATAGRRLGREG